MRGLVYLITIIIFLLIGVWYLSWIYSLNFYSHPQVKGESLNLENDIEENQVNYFKKLDDLLKFFPFARLKDYKTIEFVLPKKVETKKMLSLPKEFDVIDPKTGFSVNVYWSKPEVLPDVYELCKKLQEEKEFLCTKLKNTETEFIDTEVELGKIYQYKLKLIKYNKECPLNEIDLNKIDENKNCKIEESQETEIKTVGPVQDTTPPSPPLDVKVELKKDDQGKPYVLIEFTPAASKDLYLTRIYKSTRFGDIGIPFKEISPSDPPRVKDYSIEPGKEYYYILTSVDVNGNESIRKTISIPGNVSPFKSLEEKGFIKVKEETQEENLSL